MITKFSVLYEKMINKELIEWIKRSYDEAG